MLHSRHNAIAVLLAAALSAGAGASAFAQGAGEPSRLELLERDASGLLERVFGRNARASRAGQPEAGGAEPTQVAQAQPAELIVRLERLENQVRQLTGIIEQLQFRNQQLERQLQHASQEDESRGTLRTGQPRSAGLAAPGQTPSTLMAPQPAAPVSPAPEARRPTDVFDPAQNPDAPGAPRTLGTLSGGAPVAPAGPSTVIAADRHSGTPLDLTMATGKPIGEPAAAPPAAGYPPSGGLPPPPPRNPNATGAQPQQMVMAPSNTPKDEFDLAQGYVQRKDYALAEESFRAFLKKYPNDRLAADANYWLGESLFQRQRYREAAESFLNVSTKFERSAKAADSLLRLGQSLAALKEKEAACATLAEVGRKYPKASPSVRQGAERELKRVGC